MLRGLYTATAGMMTQQRIHDTVTQNISNVNTTGYKQVNSVARAFPEVLVSLVGSDELGGSNKIGKLNTGVFAEESLSSYTQGDLRETGKTSDFALISSLQLIDEATGQNMPFDDSGKYVNADGEVIYQPQAFFTVIDETGNLRYTRDGNFGVAPTGELLTSQGYQVVDADNNPIILNGSINDLTSDSQGNLLVNGQAMGAQIQVSVVNNPQELVRLGNGVFKIDNPERAGVRTLEAADAVEVRQRYLEGSNVNTAQAMVDMMAAQRAYEANQKMIQYYDSSLDKAVNEVGRI